MTRTLNIYHNPRCSKSRTALKYLEENQKEYEYQVNIILYQKAPPSTDELKELATYLGLTSQPNSTQPWKVLLRPDAKASSWQETYDLIERDPAQLERPFIVDFQNQKAALGRPNLDDIEKLVKLI